MRIRFEKRECGLALRNLEGNILGWVLTTLGRKYTYKVAGKKTSNFNFNTEDQAKLALVNEVCKEEI